MERARALWTSACILALPAAVATAAAVGEGTDASAAAAARLLAALRLTPDSGYWREYGGVAVADGVVADVGCDAAEEIASVRSGGSGGSPGGVTAAAAWRFDSRSLGTESSADRLRWLAYLSGATGFASSEGNTVVFLVVGAYSMTLFFATP
jgi:hypothetical protein